ncbi:1-(5-phosphoribosyl)-5-[(5-phosphoribosylamino)methylideneamino]imidazole-4-carboxamide isomerase [Legionella hackeliae]|uniref:1-(5-phosphoribosyl)-5-[(5-phosphoribosylamino)methylideneamino] imidazole-4-carboxamide isomerase n=1 Tax=Legionella hackeliae TaxID=449 RepID=A0A0A8USD3_LEGHA|nr:1-(5-phosphoribosyl)-5-[(5-phosphoribosylamino)methylideneamino]imidazole-4-carboxamide isomerase [Legionella hackeliae]KTD13747.1 phosphoribosylformimino-5-aminoimidazole carboxamide ribotide isomerase [Legionella hackeliae]CEK10446.1 1-(5-phosphoribosyl)-5-[(5-phosphoribosylamino)methylideneamino] imidazole-4-carboxamide isomerase [Legionella hackeliae]STX47182.1 phosphoribosylformimino-5-aminoimidazole carboxamide ribotide isomerase [Legionella hackeliae]
MLIIPAIDLKEGQCVRLRQGQFNLVSIYQDSPALLAQRYAAEGASRLHIVDLDGAQVGQIQQLPLIQTMKIPNMSIQLGGGIRSLASAKACLDAGINKLVISSIAVTNPDLTSQIIKQANAESIVLALDVNIQQGVPRPAIHGWQTTTQNNLWQIVSYYQLLGIREILCTDIAQDGMMSGPNFKLYEEAIRRFPNIAWQASGGIRHEDDLNLLSSLGVSGAILGRMLYETDFDLGRYLKESADVS